MTKNPSTSESDAKAALPLSGLRVLDLSHIIAGPMCCVVLADFGADVIKVEPPIRGDRGRAVGPYVRAGQEHVSSYFATMNRNRRGIVLDLKSESGKQALKQLVISADILVENFSPGTMDKLGLGWEVLKCLNPKLIYAAISGFGQLKPFIGPWSNRPANNATAQGMSGLMELSGDADGPPAFVGAAVGDTVPGLWAVIGIMMALEQRKSTQQGQFVDVAMYDSMAAMCFNAVANFNATGTSQSRGAASWEETLTGRFKCSDGYVAVSLWGTVPEKWLKLWQLIGRDDMINHPTFDSSHPGRPENAHIARPVLDKWLAITTRKDAVELLLDLGFSAGPVQTIAEVANCEQLKAREAFFEIEDGLGGHIRTLGVPLKFSAISFENPIRAPRLGEHTDEILREVSRLSAARRSQN